MSVYTKRQCRLLSVITRHPLHALRVEVPLFHQFPRYFVRLHRIFHFPYSPESTVHHASYYGFRTYSRDDRRGIDLGITLIVTGLKGRGVMTCYPWTSGACCFLQFFLDLLRLTVDTFRALYALICCVGTLA